MFILFWGLDKYADWILITSLSTFFGITDLGLNRASNNEFVIKFNQKEYDTCLKLQSNAFLFVLIIFGLLLVTAGLIYSVFGFKEMLGVNSFDENETSFAFVILLCEVFIMMYGRVYHGIYRATSRTHIVIILDNLIRVSELIILLIGIYFKIDVVQILIFYISPSIIGVFLKHIKSQKMFKSGISISYFDLNTLKLMLKPSLAFMFFPLGQAISNQGLVLVIKMLLGGPALVVFTTTRTLVNFMRQLMNMLSTSINPEICAAYGRNDFDNILNIYNRSFVVTLIFTLLSGIGLLIFGEYIFLEWTRNTILFNSTFFTGMIFVLTISCLSGLSSVIPLSTNTHFRFTIVFLYLQALSVFLNFLILKINPNIIFVPVTLFLSESLLFIYLLRSNNRMFNINIMEMYLGMLFQSKFLFQKGIKFLTRIN